MDALILPSPDTEHDDSPLRARLPGEASDALDRYVDEAGDAAHHQNVPDFEPGTDRDDAGSHQEAPAVEPGAPMSGERPMPPRKPGPSRSTLLLAGAGVGALVLTLSVYALTSHARHPAQPFASAHAPASPVLAPSASLASVAVPSHQPVMLPHYDPAPRKQELGELLAFQSGVKGASPVATPDRDGKLQQAASVALKAEAEPLAQTARPTAPSASAAQNHPAAQPVVVADHGPVPGLVVREPGSQAARRPVAVAPAAVAAATLPPRQASKEPGSDTMAKADTPPSGSDTTTAAPAPPGSGSTQDGAPQDADAQAMAAKAGAAPAAATLPDEQQLLGMITRLGYALHDLQRRNLQLQNDLARLSMAATTHLADDERRIALMEAGRSVSAAGETIEPTDAPATRAASAALMRTISFNAPGPADTKTYRVQAASPGLAMLAEVDRGGGDGAQIQIQVGDALPGYGRVRTIKQQGTAWVVNTDHGQIQ